MIEWIDASGEAIEQPIVDILNTMLRDHDTQTQVNVVVTSDDHIQQLNRDYRQLDRPTAVLSFELLDDTAPESDCLGEIYISSETAQNQALEAGRDLQTEVSHLAIHGMLRLLGYEHETDEGYERMRAQEDRYLERCRPLSPNSRKF